MNHLLGEKVAIVSNKPQTTRTRIAGILTRGEDQFVFIDTPGVHHAKNKLGEYMMKTVDDARDGVDAIMVVVDGTFIGKNRVFAAFCRTDECD